MLFRERLSDTQKKSVLGPSLVPLAMRTAPFWKRHAEELGAFYQTDLPSPATFDEELVCWNVYWQGFEIVDLPSTPQQALAAGSDEQYTYFPNVNTLLRIICTLPVTTCSCERSISGLRRLKTYLRSTMGQTRLNGLALLHFHYPMEIDYEEVISVFARKHSRKMELINISDG